MAEGPFSNIKNIFKNSIFVPVLLILALKLFYDDLNEIMIFLCFIFLGIYNDKKFQIIAYQKNSNTKVWGFLQIISSLGLSIFAVYYTYMPDPIFKCLFLMYTSISSSRSVWWLLWLLIITDYVLDYLGLVVKSLIALLPQFHQNEGFNQYKGIMLTDNFIQVYRMMVPVVPVIAYMTDIQPLNDSRWFNASLVVFYFIIQLFFIYAAIRNIYRKVKTDFNMDRYPSYSGSGICTICHEQYNSPVVLQCGCIFCKLCLYSCLLRMNICPICDTIIIPCHIPCSSGVNNV